MTGNHRGTASGFGACTRVCVQMCTEVEEKMKGGHREEQKQAQAGVNELCWTQLQLDNLYDSFQF